MNTEELKLNSMKYQVLQKLAKKHGVKAKQIYQGPIISAIITQKEIENTPEISNNDAVDVMMAQTKAKPLK